MGFWPIVMSMMKNSDVVLLVADARMPDITQNKEVVKKVDSLKGKKLILVFNKSDLISQEEKERLQHHYPEAYFISGKNHLGIRELKTDLEALADTIRRPDMRIGIVGYPNVGKSTLINALAPGAKAKVSFVSGTTRKVDWIRVGKLRIMDSPGIIPSSDKSVQVGITGAKNPHKINNVERVAIELVERLRKKGNKTLEHHYEVEGETDYDFFLNLGKKKGFLHKGGEIDEQRTAIMLIDDWQKGKIKVE